MCQQRHGVSAHAGGTGSLAHRKCDVQYVEKSRLSFRAQFRPRLSTPLRGVCHADDVGVFGGSGATTVLSAVPGGLGSMGQQTPAVGKEVVSLNCRDEVLPRNTTQYELYKGRKSPDCLAV